MQNTVWHNWWGIFSDLKGGYTENGNFTYLLLALMLIGSSGDIL